MVSITHKHTLHSSEHFTHKHTIHLKHTLHFKHTLYFKHTLHLKHTLNCNTHTHTHTHTHSVEIIILQRNTFFPFLNVTHASGFIYAYESDPTLTFYMERNV